MGDLENAVSYPGWAVTPCASSMRRCRCLHHFGRRAALGALPFGVLGHRARVL